MALLLFGLFAVCILSVLLTGADVYKRLTERDRDVHEMRTAGQYLATKVRQADAAGWIRVEKFEGLDALVIEEEIEGTVYQTWIYCHDGFIKELFAAADSGLKPEDGEKILEAEGLAVCLESSAIKAEIISPDGAVQERYLHLRSGKEVIR